MTRRSLRWMGSTCQLPVRALGCPVTFVLAQSMAFPDSDPFAPIDKHFAARDWPAAASALDTFLASEPENVEALLRRSTVHLRLGEYRAAKNCAMRACEGASQASPPTLLAIGRQLMALLENDAMVEVLRDRRFVAAAPAMALAEAGTLLSGAGANLEALELLDLAVAREPRHAPAHYFRGNLQMFLGQLDEAEHEFEQALTLEPRLAQASWALSGLRKNTAERNHVERIQKQLAAAPPGTPAEIFLCFALFNELHDLGRHEQAWTVLTRGCRSKRAQTAYDPIGALQLIAQVKRLCAPNFVEPVGCHVGGGPIPIFVIGMFRSGTTLLERILGGHSLIADGGESYAFSAQLKWATDHNFQGALDAESLRRAADIDYDELARRYIAALQSRARGKPYVTEKLPSNFLNVGLIARALPQARFLHMVRDPVDTCFSNLRTLFTHTCGYSYDQVEMAEYFIAYRGLMAHWDKVLPGRVLDVNYSELVDQPHDTARRIFAHCGLDFEANALDIERNASSVTTASAAQVRGGICRDRGAAWVPYREQLSTMIGMLK